MKVLITLVMLCSLALAQIDSLQAPAVQADVSIPGAVTGDAPPLDTVVPQSAFMKNTPAAPAAPLPDGSSSLTITVSPDSARIFIDGTECGIGTTTQAFMGTSPHELACTAPGYEGEHRRVILRAGTGRTEAFILKPVRKRPGASFDEEAPDDKTDWKGSRLQ